MNGTNACVGKPGTQVSGYAFGIGQNASGIADNDGVGGRRPEVTLVDVQAILKNHLLVLEVQDMCQDMRIV